MYSCPMAERHDNRRSQDDDEDHRQEEDDHRHRELRRQGACLFFRLGHSLIARLVRLNPEGDRDGCTIRLRLDQRRDQRLDRRQARPIVKIIERGLPIREESHFRRGQSHLFGERRAGLVELLGDTVEAGLDRQARLDADDEEVERIRIRPGNH